MNFAEFAFRRLNGQLHTRDYIEWAEKLLMAGNDVPSVAELASCSLERDPDAKQVESLFLSCVTELELSLPVNWEDAFSGHIVDICNRTIIGTIEPQECISTLLTLSDDNYDPYIMLVWIDLARDFSAEEGDIVFNNALNLENQADCIRKTASQFVALCSIELPHKFPLIWFCRECGEVREDKTRVEMKAQACPACKSAFALRNMRFFESREDYIFRNKNPR